MVDRALFSSRSEEWETPQDLFDRLNHIFAFALDACATPKNAKCRHYFTKADDALSRDWHVYGRIWLNPPYGRAIGSWLSKACSEARKGAVIVALVPARTDARWWHTYVREKSNVFFLKGRLKYRHASDCKRHSAPFPSALLVFSPDLDAVCNAERGKPGQR